MKYTPHALYDQFSLLCNGVQDPCIPTVNYVHERYLQCGWPCRSIGLGEKQTEDCTSI